MPNYSAHCSPLLFDMTLEKCTTHVAVGSKHSKAYPSQRLLYPGPGEAHVDDILHQGWVSLGSGSDSS